VVEQANANYAAQVRARAQAEKRPGAADRRAASRRTCRRLCRWEAEDPGRHPAACLRISSRGGPIFSSRSIAALRKTPTSRRPRGIFSAHRPHRQPGTASATLAGFRRRIAGSGPSCLRSPYRSSKAGALRANLDAANIRKDIGIAQYEKGDPGRFREVADGLAARGTYDEQLAAQERYTATAAAQALSSRSFAIGTESTYLNVLRADRTVRRQQTLVATRLQRLHEPGELYRALGGGWIERTGDEPRPGTTGWRRDARAASAAIGLAE